MIQTRHMSFFFLVKLDKSIGQVDKKKNKQTNKKTNKTISLLSAFTKISLAANSFRQANRVG